MPPTDSQLENQDFTDEEPKTLLTVRNVALAGAGVLIVAGGALTYTYKDKIFGGEKATESTAPSASTDKNPTDVSPVVTTSATTDAGKPSDGIIGASDVPGGTNDVPPPPPVNSNTTVKDEGIPDDVAPNAADIPDAEPVNSSTSSEVPGQASVIQNNSAPLSATSSEEITNQISTIEQEIARAATRIAEVTEQTNAIKADIAKYEAYEKAKQDLANAEMKKNDKESLLVELNNRKDSLEALKKANRSKVARKKFTELVKKAARKKTIDDEQGRKILEEEAKRQVNDEEKRIIDAKLDETSSVLNSFLGLFSFSKSEKGFSFGIDRSSAVDETEYGKFKESFSKEIQDQKCESFADLVQMYAEAPNDVTVTGITEEMFLKGEDETLLLPVKSKDGTKFFEKFDNFDSLLAAVKQKSPVDYPGNRVDYEVLNAMHAQAQKEKEAYGSDVPLVLQFSLPSDIEFKLNRLDPKVESEEVVDGVNVKNYKLEFKNYKSYAKARGGISKEYAGKGISFDNDERRIQKDNDGNFYLPFKNTYVKKYYPKDGWYAAVFEGKKPKGYEDYDIDFKSIYVMDE